jgi:hypothetical protein
VPRKIPKGKPFPKGVSGNPLGGKLHNPELRAIKRLTAVELAEIGSMIVKGNLKELQAVSKDPNVSVIKAMCASVAIKIISKGDSHALDVFLNRLIGKTPDKIQLSGVDGGPMKTLYDQMTHEERVSEAERLRKIRREAGND